MDDLSKGYSMNAYTSDNPFMQFIHSLNALKAHIPFAACILVLLILIHLLNMALNFRLNYLGIRPRQIKGLIGIPCAPFIHANFTHLLFNSLPLFVFVDVILLQGYVIFFVCTFLIVLTSGGADLAFWPARSAHWGEQFDHGVFGVYLGAYLF